MPDPKRTRTLPALPAPMLTGGNEFEGTPETTTATLDAVEPPWQVVVLNDPVNLMSYVVMVFRKVFGYTQERARKHMLEVHHEGRSVLWTGARERAEHFVHQLHQWQLSSRIERGDE
ncbi:MAG: ATP-dependent Clp protease adapter ClpS [Opitutales bacterium]